MSEAARLPVFATAKTAYQLLWTHRALHAKAIWPPIALLVAAEFIFHKVDMGTAQGIDRIKGFLEYHIWYRPAATIAALWLAGLKFLLSFSISWRRHIMLGERFDPFYFKRPFWKYLALLAANYAVAGLVLLSLINLIEQSSYLVIDNTHCTFVYNENSTRFTSDADVTCPATIMRSEYQCYSSDDPKLNTCPATPAHSVVIAVVVAVISLCFALCAASQVLAFNKLALSVKPLDFNDGVRSVGTNLHRYLAVWLLVMLPVFAATEAVNLANNAFDIDVASTPVTLAESAFRQACLFVHFSLGASIGMLTYARLVQGRDPQEVR